jgi:hypothetical protein
MTFIEITFAVVILGIGLIMIAAVFPVAIQQTQSNVDETMASTIARNALSTFESATITSLFTSYGLGPPYTKLTPGTPPSMVSFYDGDALYKTQETSLGSNPSGLTFYPLLWRAIRGNVICTTDPRYAWTGFYSWDVGQSYAKFVIIVSRVRNKSFFDEFHDVLRTSSTSTNPAALEGSPLGYSITLLPSGLYSIQFTFNGAAVDTNQMVGPLAYFVIGQDQTTVNATLNGYVVRVGNLIPGSSPAAWQIMPGNDLFDLRKLLNLPAQLSGTGYMVGRGLTVSPSDNPIYEGPVQDIAAYWTYVYMQ